MAATLAADHKLYMSIPIAKMEEVDDGIMVYGKASDGRVDADDQVVSPEWSGSAIQKWLETGGNVRVSHNPQLYPAGRGVSVEVDRDGDGGHWVKSLIVEPTAMKLVRAGVLRAYSVGIARPTIKRDLTGKARGGIVTGGEVAEISLVDRPANDGCGITLVKSAGDDAAWTHGDLVDLLVKAEAAALVTKGGKPDEGDAKGGKAEADDAQDEDVQEQEDDTDGGDNGDGKKDDGEPEDTQKSYATARADWLAREPKAPASDIGPGTAFLAKMAAMSQWEAWDAEGHELGLDGTAQGYQTWLAKRNVDPNVGGGVDRDAMDAQDFIDPDGRRFPIHSPGDVSDAVSSYGRAKPLIPMRKFKARLRAIARRKGPEFEAALPESWTGKNFTTTSPNPTGLAPYNLQGQQRPFRHDPIDDDEDEKTDMMEADLTKGGKSCKGCGRAYDADAKTRKCEGCGKKLPKATMVTKAGGLKCFKCGASNEPGARRCADCGKKLPKMLGKAAQALLTKAGVHEWKHGWIWVGPGPNPRLHGHMKAHHEAMAKGKWAEATNHLHAASMVANSDKDKALADRLMEHAGRITSGAPSTSGKMTVAERNLHQHLAMAHDEAAHGQHDQAMHHVMQANEQRKRLERRHGKETEPKAGSFIGNVPSTHGNARPVPEDDSNVPATHDADRALTERQHRIEQEVRAEWARAEADGKKPQKRVPTTAARAGEIAARHFAEAREQRHTELLGGAKPAKGPGHDSFDGRSRPAWQAEARREGVKPRRGAPAHEIAGQVGEHRHRRALENSFAINPYGHGSNQIHDASGPRKLTREEQAAAVEQAVARFRAEHDAKVGRLGDSTGMGIYPTVQGNQAAHEARMRRGGGMIDAPPVRTLSGSTPLGHGPVRAMPGSQAARDEAARASVSQGEHPGDAAWRKLAGASNRDAAASIMGGMKAAELRALADRWNVDTKRSNGKPFTKPMLVDELAGAYGRNAKLRGIHRIKAAGVDMAKSTAPPSDKKRLLPPDVLPAGPHREPDGDAVEALEADAGMTTTPDIEHDHVSASVMKTYATQRMHDALCPAYEWGAVTQAYPALSSVADAVDPSVFDTLVLKAAETGNTTEVVYAGVLHDNADIIVQHLEPAMLADARADMVAKSFGPPPQPEDYRRGYIAAGHATMTAPATRIPMVPPVAHTIHPDDFHRGLITEGHQAQSPSDRGDNLPTTSTASGAARDFYTTASRAAVATTMKALHDHLVATIPGMCPMAESRPVMPADMQATSRPHPTDPAAIAYATKSYSDDDYDEQPPVAAGLNEYALAQLIKGAVKSAVVKATKSHRREIDALRAEIDELGAAPDPTQAPIRGAVTVAKAQTTAPAIVPVERVSLVEQAQLQKAAADADYVTYLQKMAGSDNPTIREQAEDQLGRLLTKIS